jgi:hypothetical protein
MHIANKTEFSVYCGTFIQVYVAGWHSEVRMTRIRETLVPSDYYDAPIYKVLHFIRSVGLIRG